MPYGYDDYLDKIVEVEDGDNRKYMAVRYDKFAIKKVTKTTFIYQNESDNRIWPDDEYLVEAICKYKRESRMGNDNSEDALTWNVFRGMEKSGLLKKYLSDVVKMELTGVRLIYWSYDQDEEGLSSLLRDGREGIGEDKDKGTEPDLLVVSDQAIISIEAKLYASNNVPKGNERGALNKYKRYNEKEHLLSKDVTVEKVCIDYKKYELMRNWFLGSEMAGDKKFFLLNLVLDRNEKIIEDICHELFADPNGNMTFKRITWEEIYRFVLQYKDDYQEAKTIVDYMKNKGSFVNGKRQYTFDLKKMVTE